MHASSPINTTMYVETKGSKLVIPVQVPYMIRTLDDNVATKNKFDNNCCTIIPCHCMIDFLIFVQISGLHLQDPLVLVAS